jgi:hypothetical protein
MRVKTFESRSRVSSLYLNQIESKLWQNSQNSKIIKSSNEKSDEIEISRKHL